MSSLLALLISLLFLLSEPTITLANRKQEEEEFMKNCPPSTCGSGSKSLQIRFPLRLRPAPPACGLPGLDLTCSGNDTLLSLLPSLPPFKVTAIDYGSSVLILDLGSWFGSEPCQLLNLSSLVANLTTPVYSPQSIPVSWARCSSKFVPRVGSSGDYDLIAGPLPACFDAGRYFIYVVYLYEAMDKLPRDCEVFSIGGEIPILPDSGRKFSGWVEDFSERRVVNLFWRVEDSFKCWECEQRGRQCGFSSASSEIFCLSRHHGSDVKLITGTSIGGLLIILSGFIILLNLSRQSKKEKETRLKVEKFLATYKATKPTRYTYSGIMKITKRFRHKLGEGGFGSVYKGELPNGIPVAVKMLESSKGEGEDFINEVATIGRIHHVNIVRLLGFCSEGTNRALIYEFMPNESLEKFIFPQEAKRCHQALNMENLLDIAAGVARGMEYLHQGCDQRILHFDIKPHNILLDHNFHPKISDFGLAKLCSREHSIVTMTAARGTMGYIAPEIYSRNFGAVSYKSDVYSFGMLLLEMVSGRRTVEPAIENQNEVYFPEWIYDRLIREEDLGLVMQKGREENLVKKLVIVALWCIQWSPTDRPTMSRVIQLLMGNSESLQIPPKPFVSAYQDNVLAILGRFIVVPLFIYVFLANELWKTFLPIDTVEKFLRCQQTLMPTRYAYTDIIAMTRHFKEKLGQGGFGSVFKGELPGGHLVAIKMLGSSKCDGEDFISEVSTIGHIHHVNVVRLVGFCSEGSNRALIYEFMRNGSLDKYIFSSNGTNQKFTMEKLSQIALGVARGIDYLHRGCDMRILHFDIKPHNILLDQNFNPKVSDFGLAKLYPRDYSIVSACAARGTIGYMAPELVSRSFGLISYKSDVYSFGMLLLEMAGGRRNVDRQVENSSQVYYPSWIYHQLEQREKLRVCSNNIEIDNVERKLCKVGLWCIQMRSSDRPSMGKVVEMLEADVDTVDMPPKPFLFSSPAMSIRQSSMQPSLTEISTIYETE